MEPDPQNKLINHNRESDPHKKDKLVSKILFCPPYFTVPIGTQLTVLTVSILVLSSSNSGEDARSTSIRASRSFLCGTACSFVRTLKGLLEQPESDMAGNRRPYRSEYLRR
jgi:hypothetical protein